MPTDPPDLPRLEIATQDDLWAWLAANRDAPKGVLLITWKAAHPQRYVARNAVLDALAAHGWIDGRRWALDADRTMQLIAPRAERTWAQSYKVRAARLVDNGRMHPAALADLKAAMARPGWTERDHVDALKIPDDLQEALGEGMAWFDASAPSYRRNVLRFIAKAKRPETRARRIATVANHAKRSEKVPQF